MTTQFTGFSDNAKDYDIRVENRKVGAGVHITGDKPLSNVGYWSIKKVNPSGIIPKGTPAPYLEEEGR